MNHLKPVFKLWQLLVLAGIFLFCSKPANATHAAGADFTYRCLGGLQYELNLTFYRDCGGVAEPNTIDINYHTLTGYYTAFQTITATKDLTSGQEITSPCATTTTKCNGGTYSGIRKWRYTAIVTLPAPAVDWVFSYQLCCRNCAITTISTPCSSGISNLYVEATLNNVDAPCNNSPTFSSVPIAFVYVGQNFNYNHGVLDSDGDSLVYSLITPRFNATTNVTFIAPHNANNPILSSTPFTINSQTGDLNFTPSQTEVGIMTVLVKEYRNQKLIGSVLRDMQVYTSISSNRLPTASGINGNNNFTLTSCANTPVCFDIYTQDPDTNQNVSISVNNGIPGATYTIIPGTRPRLHFCWTPPFNNFNATINTFTLTVKDDACSLNGVQIFSYTIFVPPPYFKLNATNNFCNGETEGTAAVVPLSGGPYNYLWSNGATTQSISNLAAGNYSVTVSDAGSGCAVNTGVVVTQPAPIVLNSAVTNANCSMVCNGAINLSVSGSTGYSYLWSNSDANEDQSDLCEGTYTVTVTDGIGCTKVGSYTINSNYSITGNISSSNVSCKGTSTGSINLIVANGVAPYSYLWNNGALTQNQSNVGAGSYSVTVTDQNGCTVNSSVVISEPASVLSTTALSSNITCNGFNNGSATVTASGGTGPYNYAWSNGGITSGINNLPPGTFNVTVTDAKGCSSTQSRTITQPQALTLSSIAQNVACKGLNNGAITVTTSGGTAPYNYSWSNGTTVQNPNNLSAGTYTLTIKDNNNCKRTDTVIVTEPTVLQTLITSQSNVTCFGLTNGRIKITVNGGSPSYSYLWSNNATTDSVSGVGAGTYTVTVTDANGCTVLKSVTINQPAAVLNASLLVNDVSCYGNATGTINASTSGGTAPYNYLWSNNATSASINGMISGSYTFTVTDANGCTDQQNATINQPTAPLNAVTTATDVLCFGNATGAGNVTVSGGTATYSYLWSNGATTQNINAVPKGNYTVTVTDVKGCKATKSISITQPASVLSKTETVTNVKCFGGNNGNITLNITGGTSPYIYNWSNGTAGSIADNLTSGNYTVTVTDANNCSLSSTYNVAQPLVSLALNTNSVTNVNCFGGSTGSASINATGGTSPYSYLWNNGVTTSYNSNLASGNYTATVTDANNCTSSLTTINIGSPAAALSITTNQTDVKCYLGSNGTATVLASFGTPSYQYQWNTGASTSAITDLAQGTYTVTVKDANGCSQTTSVVVSMPQTPLALSSTKTDINCIGNTIGSIDLTVSGGTPVYTYNWSNGSTQQDLVNLVAGTYDVTVTDNNGCTSITNATITQPAGALTLSSAVKAVKCFGNSTGDIDITTSAGTPPYSFQWNNGSTNEDLSNLQAGSYTLTITDANGCILTNTIFITQPLQQLAAAFTSEAVKCFGDPSGSIDMTASGGTSPYSYLWNNNSTTEDLTAVASGTYNVTITDSKQCVTTGTFTVDQPSAPMSASVATTNLNCHNVVDGAINLTLTGGTTPYTYSWSNGSTSEDLNMLQPGVYSVTVTDKNNCTLHQSYTLQYNAAALTATSTSVQVLCFGNNTGAIDLSVSGGTGPYSYQWNNNSSTEDQLDLLTGTYSVTVTDANGCTVNYTTSIQQPSATLMVNSSKSDEFCHHDKKGMIDLSVSGGTPPYSFIWSDGSTTEDIAGLDAGTYTVTVTDKNGCTWSNAFNVNGPAAPLAVSFIPDDPACFGNNTGSIIINPSGGTMPYQINWSTGASSTSITDLTAGQYIVTITDTNACTITQSITLSQPAQNVSATSQVTDVDCYNNSTGVIKINPSGGTAPYLFVWNDGFTSSTHNQLAIGTYYYTVTDAHNCIYKDSALVTQPAAALQVTGNTVDVDCFSETTGSISLNVTGGTNSYNYLWSNGSTTAGISQLQSGTYSVTVTDAKNCISTNSFNVKQPTAALAIQSSSLVDVKCHGELTGSITLNMTGGTAPYQYNWYNGNTSSTLNNISAGTYNVMITDKNGCTISASYTIQEPSVSLSMTNMLTNVSCFGGNTGNINVSTAGGTGPYTYLWSNGSTNEDLVNSESGIYTLTITDLNQCTVSHTWTITQPAKAIANTFMANDVKCFGANTGSINTQITGGTAPYNYQWNAGQSAPNLNNITSGTYILTVTDANGCIYKDSVTVSQPSAMLQAGVTAQNLKCKNDNAGAITLSVTGGTPNYTYLWSNGSITQNLNNLPAGSYFVTITDANHCMVKNNIELHQPSQELIVDATVNNVTCYGLNNGTITLTISGGDPAYQVLWNTGATTATVGNLVPGLYVSTVTDANGCAIKTNVDLQQPAAALALSVAPTNSNCLNGTSGNVNAIVAGGNPPYQYLWNNGSTSASISQIISGTYTVTVTDLHGCSKSNTANISDGSSLAIQTNGPAEICVGNMITLTAQSVNGAQLQWYYNNIALIGANGNSFTTPAAGTYTLTATNNCGTYTSNPIHVTTRTLQNISVSNNFIICAGERAQLIASGGTQYSWSPSDGLNNPNIFNPVASPVKTTQYTVTISDNYGCKATASVDVSVKCDTLDVPNGFSPNGDGTNDYFVIDGLSSYPENTLFIYNRWGNLIYKKQQYDNKWDGKSNVGGIYLGRTLPNGTYYYILDLKNDEKPLSGFVVIRR